jgi:NADH:ubiquinone oxidoreductase subunit 3 (subunit A)
MMVGQMSLPRFLSGMLFVLSIFAVEMFFVTQSPWTAFIKTLQCAVLIQLGYFVATLFLVWRSKDKKKDGTGKQVITASRRALRSTPSVKYRP